MKDYVVKHCVVCSQPYQTKRADSKTCGAACRHTLWRRNKKADKLKRKYLIEKQYAPMYAKLIKNCPELEETCGQYIERFDKEAFYAMISIVDYVVEKGCV